MLLYLLGRALWIGFRGRGEGLRPVWPAAWLLVAALFLIGFRVGLNVADSGAIDVGYASVVGADRITHGEPIYDNFPEDVSQGDTYGPVNYLAYVPFEVIWPWSGTWDDLPGRPRRRGRLRPRHLRPALPARPAGSAPGPTGRKLAATLAFGWAAYPYTAYVLESNSNDTLVAAAPGRDPARSRPPDRPRGAGGARDLRPSSRPCCSSRCSLTYRGRRRGEAAARSARLILQDPRSAFVLASSRSRRVMLWPAIDPGLHTFYDRTIAYQAGRDSPFSIWGQVAGLEPLRIAILVAAGGLLAIAFAFRPRRKTLTQVAALGAALLIGAPAHRAALVLPLHRLVLPAAAGRAGGGADCGRPPTAVRRRRRRAPSPARSSQPAPAR